MKQIRTSPVAVLYIVAVVFYFVNWLLFRYQISNDTVTYFEPGRNLFEFGIFGFANSNGDILPSAMRTPLLPFILGGLHCLTHDRELSFSIFTFLLVLIAPLYPLTAWFLGKKINPKLASFCYLIVLFSFNLLNYSTYVLTDFLLGIFFNATILFSLISDGKITNWKRGLVIGGLIGVSALLRPTMVYALPAMLIGIGFSQSWRTSLRLITPAVIVFGITIAPWVVRNWLTFDKVLFTTFSGPSLAWSIGDMVQIHGNEKSGVLAAKKFIVANKSKPGSYVEYRGKDYYLANPTKVDSTLKQVAVDAYRTNPTAALRMFVRNFNSTMFGIMTTQVFADKILDKTGLRHNPFTNYFITSVIYCAKYFYLTAVPLGCIFLLFNRFRLAIIPLLLCAYVLGLTSLVSGYDRFRVPLEPIFIWTGCYGIYSFIMLIKNPVSFWRKPEEKTYDIDSITDY